MITKATKPTLSTISTESSKGAPGGSFIFPRPLISTSAVILHRLGSSWVCSACLTGLTRPQSWLVPRTRACLGTWAPKKTTGVPFRRGSWQAGANREPTRRRQCQPGRQRAELSRKWDRMPARPRAWQIWEAGWIRIARSRRTILGASQAVGSGQGQTKVAACHSILVIAPCGQHSVFVVRPVNERSSLYSSCCVTVEANSETSTSQKKNREPRGW